LLIRERSRCFWNPDRDIFFISKEGSLGAGKLSYAWSTPSSSVPLNFTGFKKIVIDFPTLKAW